MTMINDDDDNQGSRTMITDDDDNQSMMTMSDDDDNRYEDGHDERSLMMKITTIDGIE